jgi:hypothetical protein
MSNIKNPCNGCIVKPCCSNPCYKSYKYFQYLIFEDLAKHMAKQIAKKRDHDIIKEFSTQTQSKN